MRNSEMVSISHEKGTLPRTGDYYIKLSDKSHRCQSCRCIFNHLHGRKYNDSLNFVQRPEKYYFQIMKASVGYLNVLRSTLR